MFKIFIRSLSLILVVSLLWNMLPVSVLGADLRDALSASEDSVILESGNTLEKEAPEEITILSERTDRRTENIKEYLLSNGNTLAAVYGNPVHYQENGVWKEIDNTLIVKNDAYVNTAGLLNVSFPQNLNGSNHITVTKDGYTLAFGMAGQLNNSDEFVIYSADSSTTSRPDKTDNLSVSTAQNTVAQLQSVDFTEAKAAAKYPELIQEQLTSRLSYTNVYDNTSITYELDSNRVKENVILSRYDATLRGYRYTLQTGNMIPVLGTDGHIDFYDPQRENIILMMPAPFLVDADNVYSWDIDVSLTGSNGTYTLTYLLPQTWLASENRTWPVVLDPVVQVEASATTIADQTVFSGGSQDHTWNYLQCGRDTSKAISRFYLQFSAIPYLTSADVVVNAQVSLYKSSTSSSNFFVSVHGVNSSWTPSGITWSNKPSFDSNATDFVMVKNAGSYSWDVTDLAREWYQTNNNYGMVFKANDTVEGQTGVNNYVQFYSSDYGSLNPQLTIEYRNTSGLEDYWDYTTASAGRAGTAYINNSAGNLVFVRNVMAFGGNRMPVSIDLVYNASDKGNNGYGLGYGWRTNFHQRVYADGTNYYVWVDADGTKHYFKKNTSDGIYYDEDKLNLQLSVSGSTKTITDLAGNTSTFDSAGRLTKMQNNQATKSNITITYTTTNGFSISQITDGVGRAYTFTYTDGKITRISYKATGTSELHYVILSYNTSHNLTGISDRDGKSCAYTYSNKLLTKASDPQGIGFSFAYYSTATNGANRISKITEIDDSVSGNYIQFSYGNKRTTLTDKQDNVRYMLFNAHGNTITVQDDKGAAAVAKYATDENAAEQKHELSLSSDLRSPNVNWLANGGFEGSGGYTVTGAQDYGITTSAYLPGKALNVIMPNNAAGKVSFSTISVAAGESCTVSAYIKLYAGEATLQLYGSGSTLGESMKLTTTYQSQWIRLSASYSNNTSAAITLTPQIHLARFADVVIDCVQLEKTAAPSHLNLLQNSDFSVAKSNTANYWWTESNLSTGDGRTNITTSVADTIDGNVMKMTGAVTSQKRVSQRVDISGSATDVLTLACWGKGYVPSNETIAYGQRQFGLRLTFYRSNGTVAGETTALFSPNTEGWQYVAAQAKPNDAYTYVIVTLLLDYNVGTVYFDGVQLSREGLGDDYSYYDNGDVKTVTNSQGQTTRFSYTGRKLTQVTNPDGSIVNYTYDTYWNVLSETVTYPGGGTAGTYATTYTYDTYGNIKSTSATGTGTSNITYTTNGNYISTYKDAKGNTTTYNYNQNTGVLTSVTDPAGKVTNYTYDSLYRPAGSSQVNGSNTLSVAYSYNGDLLSSIATGTTNYSFTYGNFGATQQVKAGSCTLATYAYDANQNLDKLTYGNQAYVEYDYDSEGRVTVERYTSNGTTITVKYIYDGVGRLVSVKDGFTNRTTNYSYDADGRLLCVETKQGNAVYLSVRYQYDVFNRVIGQSSSLRTTTTSGTNMTALEAEYIYNAQQRPGQVTVGNVRQKATYTASGTFSTLTTGTPNTSGGISTIVKSEAYTYDTADASLKQHVIAFRNSTAYTYSYLYDNKGNITQITRTDANGSKIIKYTYDAANQLVREDNQIAGYSWAMTYDKAGNILTKKKYSYTTGTLGSVLSTQSFAYGKDGWGDVLTKINSTTVTSDAIGNTLNDGTIAYTWKNGRQLATATKSGTTWTFTYDANGMRTQRSSGSTTYVYTYDGTTLAQMTVGSNALIFTYGLNGQPMSVNYNGTIYYYVTNIQGDVVGILNSSGTEVVTYTYDAWGNLLSTGGSMASTLGVHNPLRYRGYVYDTELGLYYLQSRYYNPTWGRFINADALVSTGQGILGNNMFVYCLNNPINLHDPNGMYNYALCGINDQFTTETLLGGGSGSGAGIVAGAGSVLISYAAFDTVVGGITAHSDWLDELIDTIIDKLSKSLARSGRTKYGSEFEEHHIAARKASNAKQAANILQQVLPGGVEDPLNKVMLKTSVHRRIHTNAYYTLVNYAIIAAYNSAHGDPQQQAENVNSVLGALNAFLTSLNVFSTN